MSVVRCLMYLSKHQMTYWPNHQIFNANDLVIRSSRQWVVLQVHRTSHNRHSTFDSFGCRQFLHSSIDRPYSSDRSLVDLYAPAELLVLVADELHRLFVGLESLIDPHGKWLCIGLGVVYGDIDLEFPKYRTAESLDESRFVAVGTAVHVQPAIIWPGFGAAQIVGLHDQRVTFPSSGRVAVPPRFLLPLWGKAWAARVGVPESVIGFVQDGNQRRRLDDLPRLWLHVELRDAHRQAIRVGIVLAACPHTILFQFRGPRRQRQSTGKIGTDVPKRRERGRFRIGRKRRSLPLDRHARCSTIRQTSKLGRRRVAIRSQPVSREVGSAVSGMLCGAVHEDTALSIARRTGFEILRPLRGQ